MSSEGVGEKEIVIELRPAVDKIYNLLKNEKERALTRAGKKFIRAYESNDVEKLTNLLDKQFIKIDYKKVNREIFYSGSNPVGEMIVTKLVEIMKDNKKTIDSLFDILIKNKENNYKLNKKEKEFISAYLSLDERRIAVAFYNLDLPQVKVYKKKSMIRIGAEQAMKKLLDYMYGDYYG